MSVNSVKPIASSFLRRITPPNLNGLKYIPAPAKKDFFCKQIWDDSIPILRKQYPKNKTYVTYHGILNTFNHMLTGLAPKEVINFDKIIVDGLSVREIMYNTDIEFKLLKPLEKPVVLYRCIPRRTMTNANESRLFDKFANIKPGERLITREYAYYTTDINYAKEYLSKKDGGILIEETFPAGSQISGLYECTIPRSSTHLCTDNVLEGNIHYLKMDYEIPEKIFS